MSTDVYLNDRYLGRVDDAQIFINSLKSERLKNKFMSNLSVSYNDRLNEVYLEGGKGRTIRPLI